jgi:serine-type D-Ala-D-Ala carboxypeptidase (penicillin-binding protein 5/6)
MRTLAGLCLLLLAAPIAANTPSFGGDAPVAYLIDMQSGAILIDRDSKRRIPTASMAKMMTALVAFDAIKKGDLKLASHYAVKPETWQKWNNTGSTMFLKANQKVSVDNLLHGILTLSGNDASVVFAEGFAGSESAFTVKMNRTGKALDLRDSYFGTANGWPDEGKTFSTARDLIVIARRIIVEHPKLFRSYFSQNEFRWNGVTQPNRNPLLGVIDGADGMKTGHSDEAGYCLIGTAERDGRRLMMVLAGLPTQEARLQEARDAINWGFDEWQSKTLFHKGAKIYEVPVQLGASRTVSVIAPSNIGATFPKGGQPPKNIAVRFNGPVKAPLKKGAIVAQLVMHFANGQKQSMPLVAANDVPKAGFFGRAWNGLALSVGF